jgi:hypothetical protein
MRFSATGSSAFTITAHIVSPVITAATAPPPTVIAPPLAATITSTSTDPAYASRQSGQNRNRQSDLDPANQNIRLVHTGHPFAVEIKERGNTVGRALPEGRTRFSAQRASPA